MKVTSIVKVLSLATIFLIIPITASFFVDGWGWTGFDYVFAWVMVSFFGLVYSFVASRSDKTAYKAAAALSALGVFLLVWVNGAVGILGDEDNGQNLLYAAVPLIGLLGLGLSRLKARGLSYTLFAMGMVQMLVPVVVYFIWPEILTEAPGIVRGIILNLGFATLFAFAGILFQHADEKLS